jgi:hypothetical protein
MHPAIYCIGGVCYLLHRRRRRRNGPRRRLTSAITDYQGYSVASPAARGRARGPSVAPGFASAGMGPVPYSSPEQEPDPPPPQPPTPVGGGVSCFPGPSGGQICEVNTITQEL